MQLMNTLEEAIELRYVVRCLPADTISNRYWRWCEANTKPFVAVTLGKTRSRYAQLEIDLYNISVDGFSQEACYEILHFFLGLQLKPGSTVHISPIFSCATVSIEMIPPAADFLYQIAIDEGVCHSQKEAIAIITRRAGAGQPRHRTGPSFSFDVYKDVLKKVSTIEFWESITKK